MQTRSGAEIFADALALNGVEFVYHVPAESFVSILDTLARRHTAIKLVSCRHEGGMAFMADAYGKLTGRPAVCLVTRGPGATNACLGVHTAYQDSSPMVFCVGQAGRQQMERDAFLAYDFRSMFRPMAKWVAHVDDPARLPEFLNRAFHTAMSGRMGPVVLVLPDDVQEATADVADLPASVPTVSHPAPRHITRMGELLASARRPLMIVGGEGWTTAGRDQVQEFASRNHVPLVAAFRRRDIIDNRHACFVGELGIGSSPQLLERIQEADLIIALGSRLSEMDTIGAGIMNGFTLLQAPRPEPTLIHIHPSVEELNRVYQPELSTSTLICARGRSTCPKYSAGSASACLQIAFSPMGRAPMRAGANAISSIINRIHNSDRPVARWVTVCPRPSLPSCSVRKYRSSRWRGMGVF
jgi:acetolactate synthase-1/2/3 large subunit